MPAGQTQTEDEQRRVKDLAQGDILNNMQELLCRTEEENTTLRKQLGEPRGVATKAASLIVSLKTKLNECDARPHPSVDTHEIGLMKPGEPIPDGTGWFVVGVGGAGVLFARLLSLKGSPARA